MTGTNLATDDPALTGRIFDLSRGCFEDGPGLRTVVFLKGCRLSCPWCHNPEGRSFSPEILFDPGRCIGCGRCAEVCPKSLPEPGQDGDPNGWRLGCTACGRCADVCPSHARRLSGESCTGEDLVKRILEDRDFFEGTGGGATFSGGEPMCQEKFLFSCADILRKEGIHLALETSGFWPSELQKAVADRFDLVLFDLKHVQEEKLKNVLGAAEPDLILSNLEGLLALGVPLEIRITLVPGFNDHPDDLTAMASFIKTLHPVPFVRLQPFHRLAAAKENLLGRPYPFSSVPPLSEAHLLQSLELMKGAGVREIICT